MWDSSVAWPKHAVQWQPYLGNETILFYVGDHYYVAGIIIFIFPGLKFQNRLKLSKYYTSFTSNCRNINDSLPFPITKHRQATNQGVR
jgi:hypothetical protein